MLKKRISAYSKRFPVDKDKYKVYVKNLINVEKLFDFLSTFSEVLS